MTREHDEPRVGTGYPFAQMAKAFNTALTHDDEETRSRAEGRVARWKAIVEGMTSGRLTVGSRTPVAILPAWVTLEVVRGGFATGEAAAGGPLATWERDIADRAGVAQSRAAIFGHYLGERGLTELDAVLTSGAYRVQVPEEAALLTVAWLVGAGDTESAHKLVDELAPHADRLRFVPPAAEAETTTEPSVVYRETVGDASGTLASRRPNPRVAAMREALTVWNPFAGELLSLWLETVEDGRVGAGRPDGWTRRGDARLERYQQLSAAHTLCSKHRRPKENLAILRAALAKATAGDELTARETGMLQHAVDSMVSRRGIPARPSTTPCGGSRRPMPRCRHTTPPRAWSWSASPGSCRRAARTPSTS